MSENWVRCKKNNYINSCTRRSHCETFTIQGLVAQLIQLLAYRLFILKSSHKSSLTNLQLFNKKLPVLFYLFIKDKW